MNRNVAYVALGIVGFATIEALNVIWRTGNRVARELADFGSALPGLTQFAFDFRAIITALVLGAFVAALLVHRLRYAVLALVLICLFQLSIGAAFWLALWLPYQPL